MRRPLALLGLLSLLALLTLPFVGPMRIAPSEALGNRVFTTMRVPRVLLGYSTGATLGLCGAVFQVLLRNHLASPDVMGVSSGAALGAVAAIRLGLSPVGIGAFLGSSLAIGLILTAGAQTARRGGGSQGLLLAGVASSFLFGSLNMVIQYGGGFGDSFRMLRWAMGGIQVVGYQQLVPSLGALGVTVGCCLAFLKEIRLIRCGTLFARSRGVPVDRVRWILFGLISMAVAASVSLCGPIGFVGLFGPHMARMLGVKGEGGGLWGSAMVGGLILSGCDALARTLWTPSEIPVGIITSGAGALFFLWLMLFGSERQV
ncbi:FecCD family ABC transporter permease [Thermanaerovibrio acidaminovorans]|uniref:FecCD family ABC transporter permease n=1 Tax=Thermanaerovibrio acidaminovorans TaxID=81462 RepID=UPI0024921AD9|nr:iron ABC transporter permease [Thermanaerovibrio acidaminovorans]